MSDHRLGTLLLILLIATACGGDARQADTPSVAAGAEPVFWDGRPLRTRDLHGFGSALHEAVQVTPLVYQARGTANAQLVVTSEGNVLVDTGLVTQPLQEQLAAVAPGRISHIVLSHAHADHYSAVGDFADDATEVIAHPEFLENQRYLKALAPRLMPRNRIFFPHDTPAVPGFARGALAWFYPTVEATRLVADSYAFEQGGIRFEVLALPGAEGSDGLVLWLPDQRILFTGDLFGHIFPMWPNLTTIRGERARFVMPYLASLDRVLELDPEILVPSHFYPVRGRETIRAGVKQMRDAILYVHDAVVEGINDGKDVHTLMREIELPDHLQVPEVHGKVSWGVRSIWEAYLGWFHLESTTELYAVPHTEVYPELVSRAGGPAAIAEAARARVAKQEPEAALHLAEAALSAEPGHRGALEARLAALEELLERSGDVNHYEVGWLRHRIAATREELGIAPVAAPPPAADARSGEAR